MFLQTFFITILQKGFTPLHEAARNGHVRIVEILLKHYDNPDPEGKVSELLCVVIIGSKLVAALWRRSGLMVGALASGSSGLGSSPGQGHCVVFLGKTLQARTCL